MLKIYKGAAADNMPLLVLLKQRSYDRRFGYGFMYKPANLVKALHIQSILTKAGTVVVVNGDDAALRRIGRAGCGIFGDVAALGVTAEDKHCLRISRRQLLKI